MGQLEFHQRAQSNQKSPLSSSGLYAPLLANENTSEKAPAQNFSNPYQTFGECSLPTLPVPPDSFSIEEIVTASSPEDIHKILPNSCRGLRAAYDQVRSDFESLISNVSAEEIARCFAPRVVSRGANTIVSVCHAPGTLVESMYDAEIEEHVKSSSILVNTFWTERFSEETAIDIDYLPSLKIIQFFRGAIAPYVLPIMITTVGVSSIIPSSNRPLDIDQQTKLLLSAFPNDMQARYPVAIETEGVYLGFQRACVDLKQAAYASAFIKQICDTTSAPATLVISLDASYFHRFLYFLDERNEVPIAALQSAMKAGADDAYLYTHSPLQYRNKIEPGYNPGFYAGLVGSSSFLGAVLRGIFS